MKVQSKSDFVRFVGVVQAVLAENVDLGVAPDPFNEGKTRHDVVLVFQLTETYKPKEGDEERLVQSQTYRATVSKKSSLRKLLEGMLGKVSEEVDLDSLVGKNCMLTIQQKPESEYTVIASAAPLMKGLKPIKVEGYRRPAWITKELEKRAVEAEAAKAMKEANTPAISQDELADVIDKV